MIWQGGGFYNTYEEEIIYNYPLEIYTFDHFEVKYKGKPIIYKFNTCPKIFTLFRFLITHRNRLLSVESIEENLWDDREYQDSKNAIKGQVFRLRKILKEISFELCNSELEKFMELVFKNGCYMLKLNGNYFLDLEEFQKNIEVLKNDISVGEENLTLRMNTLELYKNHFIDNLPSDQWILPIRNYYKRLYVDLVESTVMILKKLNYTKEILDILEKAMLIEPLEESFHVEFIDVLVKQGKYKEALEHYKYVEEKSHKELDIMPSRVMMELQGIIHEALRAKSKTFNNINEDITSFSDISATLMRDNNIKLQEVKGSPSHKSRACHKEAFNKMFRLEKDLSITSGIRSALMKVTLSPYLGSDFFTVYDILVDTVDYTIRKGDVFSIDNEERKGEILILLYDIPKENWDIVKKRLLKNFIDKSEKKYLEYLTIDFTII